MNGKITDLSVLTEDAFKEKIGVAFYDNLISHCGDITNVKGATTQSLINMRDGKNIPSLNLLRKIFKANDIPAFVEMPLKVKGKKLTFKIKL